MKRMPLIVPLFGLLFLVATALGDTVVFKDGRRIEGKVVEETPRWVRLRTRFGTQKIDRSRIREIRKGRTLEEEFRSRKEALRLDDIDGHVALALWCRQKKLHAEEKEVWKSILLADPSNERAHGELGHVRHGDRWYTPAELEKVKRAEWKAKGYVEYDGKWVPKEDAEKLARGLRLHEGKWMTEDEIKAAQGLVKVGDRWVTPDEKLAVEAREELEDALGVPSRTHLTRNFLFLSTLPEDRTADLADKAEKAVRYVFEFLEGDPSIKPWPGRGRYYMLDGVDAYEDYLTYIVPNYIQDKGFLKMLRDRHGGPNLSGLKARHQGVPFAADYDRDKQPWDNAIYHKVAGYCLENYSGHVPFWLLEGFSAFVEFHFTDASRVVSITNTSYGDRADLADKATDSKYWHELLKDAVEAAEDTRFLEFKNRKLNQLDYMDLSKSWSLITFWAETRKEAFVAFLRNLRTMKQDDAIVQAMGKGYEGLDDEWREWMRKTE